LSDSLASKQKRGCRAGGVAPAGTRHRGGRCERIHGGPADEVDEKAPKPGEQDTETVAGMPTKPPESKEGEQSKQDE